MPEYIQWKKAKVVDAWLSKQLEYKRHYEEEGVNFVYWPYDVAMDIFQITPEVTSNNKQYFGQYLPKVIPVGITFNWVHDPQSVSDFNIVQFYGTL